MASQQYQSITKACSGSGIIDNYNATHTQVFARVLKTLSISAGKLFRKVSKSSFSLVEQCFSLIKK